MRSTRATQLLGSTSRMTRSLSEGSGHSGLRIVAFAPACNPFRGSEAGAGWLWSRLLARLGEAWIITRPRNRKDIEAALPGLPEGERLHFVYVEVERWPKSWRTGKGRSSIDYLLWQPVAMREARRLHRGLHFDLAWHLT